MEESKIQKQQRLFAEFEKMGESQVAISYSSNSRVMDHPDKAFADEWLRLQQQKRDQEASNKRDAREEETLSVAKNALKTAENANKIATRQTRWSMWAVIIAVIALTISVKDYLFDLIFN